MKLSQAEFEVMQALWECEEPIRPSQLLLKMHDTHPWSISTLKTLLVRLKDKGAVNSTAVKRFLYYSPKFTKEEYFRLQTDKLMSQLNTASTVSLVAGLINQESVTERELDEIEELLREAKSRFAVK